MATNDRIDLLFSKVRKNIDPNVEVIIPKPIIEKTEGADIGKQIAYYRRIQGRTQKEISKKLGINRSTMNMYETKTIKLVNVKILKMIFKELNIENELMKRANNWINRLKDCGYISDLLYEREIMDPPYLLNLNKVKKTSTFNNFANDLSGLKDGFDLRILDLLLPKMKKININK